MAVRERDRVLTAVENPDWRGRHDDTHDRIQRRVRHLQEPQLQRLGPGWPDVDPAVLALLLRQHGRRHLRRRLDRH